MSRRYQFSDTGHATIESSIKFDNMRDSHLPAGKSQLAMDNLVRGTRMHPTLHPSQSAVQLGTDQPVFSTSNAQKVS